MQRRFEYATDLRKGDIWEIYCKTIANLGPLNVLFWKNFSMGFICSGYTKAQFGYLGRQIMDAETPGPCAMERGIIFGYSSRRIEVESIEDKVIVDVTDSERGIRKVERALEETFGFRETGKWEREALKLVDHRRMNDHQVYEFIRSYVQEKRESKPTGP